MACDQSAACIQTSCQVAAYIVELATSLTFSTHIRILHAWISSLPTIDGSRVLPLVFTIARIAQLITGQLQALAWSAINHYLRLPILPERLELSLLLPAIGRWL